MMGTENLSLRKFLDEVGTENLLLKKFLDEGGSFAIEKNKGRMLIVSRANIDGTAYQKGVVIDSFADIVEQWDDIVSSALSGLRKVKEKKND
ncbi:hypothetical protein LCGC14_1679590 [marine sediment metagenome]|uniref:Uncharacterized protein n=1 Tax=marine sediment metagenome TaxID=412755 RepID=A0A0F9HPJ8_9ZZZZ|nr:hypothetical protein [Pricia sp.]